MIISNKASGLNIKGISKRSILVFICFFVPIALIICNIEYEIRYTETYVKDVRSGLIMSFFITLLVAGMFDFFYYQSSRYWMPPMVRIIVKFVLLDEKVTKAELKIIRKNFETNFGLLEARKANRLLNKELKRNAVNLKNDFEKLKKVFDVQSATKFLNLLINISLEDRFLSVKEEQYLSYVCKELGLSQKTLSSMLSLKSFVYESRRGQKLKSTRATLSLQRSYEILGLDSSATFLEVKSSHRKLVKIYHPDKVGNNKNKEFAKQQFQAITDAYETIKSRNQ